MFGAELHSRRWGNWLRMPSPLGACSSMFWAVPKPPGFYSRWCQQTSRPSVTQPCADYRSGGGHTQAFPPGQSLQPGAQSTLPSSKNGEDWELAKLHHIQDDLCFAMEKLKPRALESAGVSRLR